MDEPTRIHSLFMSYIQMINVKEVVNETVFADLGSVIYFSFIVTLFSQRSRFISHSSIYSHVGVPLQ